MRKPVLLGAIIGDICGTPYEFPEKCRIKHKPDGLVNALCRFSDDTIHTCAVAAALMSSDRDFAYCIRTMSSAYPNGGYGGRMCNWIDDPEMGAYNSFGNGSAMRVSPCGYMTMNLELAEESAKVTHNHEEGIKGAKCVSDIIGSLLFALNSKYSESRSDHELKELISLKLNEYYPEYEVELSLNERRPMYQFNDTCQGSVPQSIQCVLEAESYEDAIKLAISMGGDSDTMACIAGSIASVIWEIPDYLVDLADKVLDTRLIKIIEDFDKFIGK